MLYFFYVNLTITMNPLSSKAHSLAQTRQTKHRTNRTGNQHERATNRILAPKFRACADVIQLCLYSPACDLRSSCSYGYSVTLAELCLLGKNTRHSQELKIPFLPRILHKREGGPHLAISVSRTTVTPATKSRYVTRYIKSSILAK